MSRQFASFLGMALVLLAIGVGEASAQGPTIESGGSPAPGGGSARLGPAPGSTESALGAVPGAGENVVRQAVDSTPLSGRAGATGPRAPAAAFNPTATGPTEPSRGIAAPAPIAGFRAPSYGSYSLPSGPDDDGPPDGLTLDQAIERLVHENLDLRSKFMEIPQAEADILSASLRANPIFYADAQLVPYGSYSANRPGGQTQYDVNISHPFDLSGKRHARTLYATRAKRVIEAQYQNAVRAAIDQVYVAYLNVLAARQTVRYSQKAVEGLKSLLEVTTELYRKEQNTRADVSRVQVQFETAQIGLLDAQEGFLKAKRELGALINIPPDQAESLEVRGSIRVEAEELPSLDELIASALAARPDVVAYRFGIQTAEANVRLQLANRFSDVYVLYQPYTLQDNRPLGLKSPTSWALGVTVPVPVYNRNQGGIARAKLNVTQSKLDLATVERQAITEVQQAFQEYRVTKTMVERIRNELEPAARKVRDDTFRLYRGGEVNVVVFLNAQREYQDIVKQYLDTLIRHRRSMFTLNTALGQRLLP